MKMKFSDARTVPLEALVLVTSLGAILATPVAYAKGSYGSAWDLVYPTSTSHTNADCQLCHADSTQYLNNYGESICLTSGSDISSRIRAVESLNSDNDPTGADNLTEINVGSQPGWTPGNVNQTFERGNCVATGLVEAPPSYISGDIDPVVGNQSPVADAKGPYNGTVNIPLTFDGSASSDPDGSIVTYDWNFGDGSTGSGATPTHTYNVDGVFTVTLTVTDDIGATDSVSTTATIALGNQPPVANVNGPYSGMVDVAVNFDSSGSSDPDGSIVSYAWDFGDGSSGNGSNPTHAYTVAGTYNVTLTVMDDAGATDSAATSVQIVEQPVNQLPVSNPGGPYTGTVGVAVDFDGSASVDPDGSIVDYSWDFGDGSTGNGMTPSHTYVADGNFTVTLTVTDDAGAVNSVSTSATIGLANQPPVADASGPYSGTVGVPLTFDGSASNDSDGSIVDYSWDFGDGNTANGVTPTHTYATDGSFTVTLMVTDDAGASSTATTTANIGVGNLPPVADPGGPYSVTIGNSVTFDATGSNDPDGTIVTFEWDFGDGNTGTGQTPTHTYTAPGTYNVTVTVTDDSGATDSAGTTVSVTPLADVFLGKLQAPKTIKTSSTRTVSKGIVAVAGASTLTQDATVTLGASVTGPVVVDVTQGSITDSVPAGANTRYKFSADISCSGAGTAMIVWTATIDAAKNSDSTNDTLTSSTEVTCR